MTNAKMLVDISFAGGFLYLNGQVTKYLKHNVHNMQRVVSYIFHSFLPNFSLHKVKRTFPLALALYMCFQN